MPPHAVDMSLKESAPDECRQRILLEHWNGTGIKRKLRSEPARKIHRQYHIADSYRRGKRLRECVHIYDPSRGIYALQCRQWATLHAEFTIIIILDDIPPIDSINPCEQLISATYWHSDSRGEVVIWAYMCDLSICLLKGIHPYPILVYVSQDTVHTLMLIYLYQLPVAGIFNAVDTLAP